MNKIVRLDVKLTIINPIRRSSYLPIPPILDASRLLLNNKSSRPQLFPLLLHSCMAPNIWTFTISTISRWSIPIGKEPRPIAHQVTDSEMLMQFGQIITLEKCLIANSTFFDTLKNN